MCFCIQPLRGVGLQSGALGTTSVSAFIARFLAGALTDLSSGPVVSVKSPLWFKYPHYQHLPVLFSFVLLSPAIFSPCHPLPLQLRTESDPTEKKNTQLWTLANRRRGGMDVCAETWLSGTEQPPPFCSGKNNQRFIRWSRQTGTWREYYLTGVCLTVRQTTHTHACAHNHTQR